MAWSAKPLSKLRRSRFVARNRKSGLLPKARSTAAPRAPTPSRLRAQEDRCAARAAPSGAWPRQGAPRPPGRHLSGAFRPRPGLRPRRRKAWSGSPTAQEPRLLQRTDSAAIGTSLVSGLASPEARPRFEHLAYSRRCRPALVAAARRSRFLETLVTRSNNPSPTLKSAGQEKGLSKLKSASRRERPG